VCVCVRVCVCVCVRKCVRGVLYVCACVCVSDLLYVRVLVTSCSESVSDFLYVRRDLLLLEFVCEKGSITAITWAALSPDNDMNPSNV
jgi:hypothetical protein